MLISDASDIAAVVIVMTAAQCKQGSTSVHLVPYTSERVVLQEIHILELRILANHYWSRSSSAQAPAESDMVSFKDKLQERWVSSR